MRAVNCGTPIANWRYENTELVPSRSHRQERNTRNGISAKKESRRTANDRAKDPIYHANRTAQAANEVAESSENNTHELRPYATSCRISHDVPLYRLNMIGFGRDKPPGEGKIREAATQNRRVEATVFGADQITTSLSGELS